MQQIREIVVQPSAESSALSRPGTERLSDAEFVLLNTLCKQMQAHYPNQEFDEETIEGFQFDIERLAMRYGIGRMRAVLLDIRIRPGQRFFPHPSQIAEELEELVKKEREQFLKSHPYEPCGQCHDGMVIERAVVNGKPRTQARECECKKRWRAETAAAREQAVQGKTA